MIVFKERELTLFDVVVDSAQTEGTGFNTWQSRRDRRVGTFNLKEDAVRCAAAHLHGVGVLGVSLEERKVVEQCQEDDGKVEVA